MIWFCIAVIVTLVALMGWGTNQVRLKTVGTPLFFGILIASAINYILWAGWAGKVYTHHTITSAVETKIVNDVPTYVFKTGNGEWSLPTEDVNAKVDLGYDFVVITNSTPNRWIAAFGVYPSKEYLLTIPVSGRP